MTDRPSDPPEAADMTPDTFAAMKAYIGFDSSAAALLRELHPIVEPRFSSIVEDFYGAVSANTDVAPLVTGGEPQVRRLKATLRRWLGSVFLGPHDDAYLTARTRIGRAHIRVGLPQEYMVSAMNRMRARVAEVIVREIGDDARCAEALVAVNQALDVDLAVMLDSYRADLARQLRARERLATIGQLAASIGHELRNPLAIIESSLYLVRQRLKKRGVEDDHLSKHLDKVGRQVGQCERTITDLLELARDRPPMRRKVLAQDLLVYAKEATSLPEDVVVRTDIPEALEIDADPDQLRQVLVNLISNASDAMEGRGTLHVSAGSAAGGAQITVADEGPGVPEELRARIFEALFTTKPRGNGLGLALCWRILNAHGGEIALVPSERGATFRLFIPDTEAKPDRSAESPETSRGPCR